MSLRVSRFARAWSISLCAVGLTTTFTALRATAAVVAYDTAATYPVYTSFNGVNGGTGFLPWTESVSSSGGQYINSPSYDSTGLPGQVFDIYDNGGGTLNSGVTTVTRPFASALTPGQTFSFKDVLHYANGATSGGGITSLLGFSLLDVSGNTLFTFDVSGGAAGYSLTDKNNTATVETSVAYNYQSTDTFAFTPTDAAGDYSFNVSGAGLPTGGVTFTGQTLAGTSLPASVAIFNNDGGYSSDVQFDQLQIIAVPEPASLGFAAVAMFGLLKRRVR